MDIEWFKINNSKRKRQAKLIHRTVGYDAGTKEVWLCADAFGGETRNFLCMSFDGQRMVYADGHLFCPAGWLKKEFPAIADDIDAITAKVRNEHP